MKTVLTGFRATGKLHLGNYFGAIKPLLDLGPNYRKLIMIADAHALTTPFDQKSLSQNRMDVLLDLIACGLNPDDNTYIYFQSDTPCYELSFYLSALVSPAKIQHLPSLKEKLEEPHSLALLNYPVLMAADILLYRPDFVVVGADQKSHIELTKDLIRKLNSEFNLDFSLPEAMILSNKLVPSLTGEGKMSKSKPGSFILLSNTFNEVKKVISKIPTDSGKGDTVPLFGGVNSLLELVEIFISKEERTIYEGQYVTDGIQYGYLKQRLTDVICSKLELIQKQRQEIKSFENFGIRDLHLVGKETINKIKDRFGLSKFTG